MTAPPRAKSASKSLRSNFFFGGRMIWRRSTPCFALLNIAAISVTSALLTTWRMDIMVFMSSPRADAAAPVHRGG
ncbi:hypothetical protein EVAR_85208_1 [Eumeta japonica]|uniref:Uncharacterized protein n=1 Tax=Eumeta variegata TaxID=151549 RepID=A0A4C1W1L0_EUMVA|nr:hypothetical protein EVAR_85208_1 [Eumeta japonica]